MWTETQKPLKIRRLTPSAHLLQQVKITCNSVSEDFFYYKYERGMLKEMVRNLIIIKMLPKTYVLLDGSRE